MKVKFGGMTSFGGKSKQSVKVSLRFSTNSQKFSPSKVFHYTVAPAFGLMAIEVIC